MENSETNFLAKSLVYSASVEEYSHKGPRFENVYARRKDIATDL